MADHSRTEKATPRRRERAREQGNIARSRDVSSTIVLTGCFMLFAFLGPSVLYRSQHAFSAVLTYALSQELTPANLTGFLWTGGQAVAQLAGPVMALALLLAVAGAAWQSGFHLSFTPLAPNPSKLNPASNLARIFSIQGLSEFIKSLLIFIVIAYMAWSVVRSELPMIPSLVLMPVPQVALLFGQIVYRITLRTVIFLVFIALGDYLVQKYRYEESLKMTKQEVRQEAKESEGDPMIRGKIRRVGRDILRRRMLQEVPKADVVITNPTEYAVALRYDMERMIAPQVVAKGRGYVAQRIRAIAAEHAIPIVENPPLARALHKTIEVGQQIPAELYKAVAEILAYIYRLKTS